MRNLSASIPRSRSHVHLTSAAVNALPSCHLTPCRSGKVSSLPSSLHRHSVASSGTIEARLFWGTCWSKTTRLLNTPIIGIPAVIVDSSWIDMLAGLAKSSICRIPPGFCANEASVASKAPSSALAITPARTTPLIINLPPSPPPPPFRSQPFSLCRFCHRPRSYHLSDRSGYFKELSAADHYLKL